MKMLPASGVSSPATSLRSVVLPAPVGPSSTTSSPSGIARLTSFNASTSPKRLVTRSMPISAMDGSFEEVALERAPGDGLEHDQPRMVEGEPDPFADASLDRGGEPRLHTPVVRVHRDHLHRAHVLDAEHLAADAALV